MGGACFSGSATLLHIAEMHGKCLSAITEFLVVNYNVVGGENMIAINLIVRHVTLKLQEVCWCFHVLV